MDIFNLFENQNNGQPERPITPPMFFDLPDAAMPEANVMNVDMPNAAASPQIPNDVVFADFERSIPLRPQSTPAIEIARRMTVLPIISELDDVNGITFQAL